MKTFYISTLIFLSCYLSSNIFAFIQPQKQIEIPINIAPKHPALVTIPTKESLKQYPPKTELSQKALHLRVGMTKEEVFKLLGKPTWAHSENPLILVWRNGNCNPVEVMFDHDLKVAGFDEGRAECLDKVYFAVPEDKFLCAHVDRQYLCKVKLPKNLA